MRSEGSAGASSSTFLTSVERRPFGILLAAGESTRMGELKALLAWRGGTLIECQVAEILAAGVEQLVVVLGHRRDDLEPLVRAAAGVAVARVVVTTNDRYREGKSTSIVAGVGVLPAGAQAAILVAVDQPCEASVLQALARAQAQTAAPIVVPSFEMRRGHPTLFARSLFAELTAITEAREGLREVMVRHEAAIQYVNVDNPIVRANLNTPEEYAAAYARWGQADGVREPRR